MSGRPKATAAGAAEELRELIREGHGLLKDLRAERAATLTMLDELGDGMKAKYADLVDERVGADIRGFQEGIRRSYDEQQEFVRTVAGKITVAQMEVEKRLANMAGFDDPRGLIKLVLDEILENTLPDVKAEVRRAARKGARR